jgi:cyclopropane fatty-acyl-phospholipid synthase-like methyltransferase
MISKSYLKELSLLHADKSRPDGFGGKVKGLGKFKKYMELWQPETLLDYGCGKGNILNALQTEYPDTKFTGYDPAVQEYSATPESRFDLVFSCDVLEHIEPAYIDKVLKHINDLARINIWLRIDTMPARKHLSDGRNAHLILESPDWWERKIQKHIEGNIVFDEFNRKGKWDVAIEKWYV